MNIFNILISLGFLFIIIGIYYTLFWDNKDKPNKDTEIEKFKSVNDSTLPTIKGLSYIDSKSNVKEIKKELIVEQKEVGVELINSENKNSEQISNIEEIKAEPIINEEKDEFNENENNDEKKLKVKEQLEMGFENGNHDQDDKNIYGFSIDNFKDFEEEIDSNYPIDPEEHLENIKRNEYLQNIDPNELTNEIFDDLTNEKNEENPDDEMDFNNIDDI